MDNPKNEKEFYQGFLGTVLSAKPSRNPRVVSGYEDDTNGEELESCPIIAKELAKDEREIYKDIDAEYESYDFDSEASKENQGEALNGSGKTPPEALSLLIEDAPDVITFDNSNLDDMEMAIEKHYLEKSRGSISPPPSRKIKAVDIEDIEDNNHIYKFDEKKTDYVHIIPLGGLGEIGKNMTVFETREDIVIVDCGMSFPDDTMLGVDVIVPDITYLQNICKKKPIKGLLITHAHEDHIGGIVYLLGKISVPIYATRFSAGVIQHRLSERDLLKRTAINVIKSGDVISLGSFTVEFIKVNHSIPGAVAMAIATSVGTIIHTGDFKVDTTPVHSSVIDLTTFGQYGKKGVDLLIAESTNVEREGWSSSEATVEQNIINIFNAYENQRIVIATFSSNIYRMQMIVRAALASGRKIAIAGTSMQTMFDVSVMHGYISVPSEAVIDVSEAQWLPPRDTVIMLTGSQGEELAALTRIANDAHRSLSVGKEDVIVLSSHAVPGNEKAVNNVVNRLISKGARVITDSVAHVHVSGHACKEELKLIHALVKPQYFMPVHGEAKHLLAHKNLAKEMGMRDSHIILAQNGSRVTLIKDGCGITSDVISGAVMVDNNLASKLSFTSENILKDRTILAKEGIVFVTCTIDTTAKKLVASTHIAARGFVDTKEYSDTFKRIKKAVDKEVHDELKEKGGVIISRMKENIKEIVNGIIYTDLDKRPMILISIQETKSRGPERIKFDD